MIYRETTLRGTIQSQEDVTGEEWDELRGASFLDESGTYDLLDDHEAHVVKVITDQGEFLLIAQAMDGHGILSIVERAS